MKRNLFVSAGVLVLVLFIFAAVTGMTPASGQQPSPISQYSGARYALAAAEIDVANLQNPGTTCTRHAVFRIDTATGNVSILQLSIKGDNDPTVLSAAWAPADNNNRFAPYGNSGNQALQPQTPSF